MTKQQILDKTCKIYEFANNLLSVSNEISKQGTPISPQQLGKIEEHSKTIQETALELLSKLRKA